VTYTARLSLTTPAPTTNAILTKCNCSICQKTGVVLIAPTPETSLTVLTPSDENELTDYKYHKRTVHHLFCPKCGVKCFLRGSFLMNDKKFEFSRVNALTLDGRVDGAPMEDLRKIKIKYYDGLAENWSVGLADEPAEGGMA
jgi:hypothetical protein